MRIALAVMLVPSLIACDLRGSQPARAGEAPASEGVQLPINVPRDVRPTPTHPARFGSVGRVTRETELRAWNIDVNPVGAGLPPGRGTYDRGVAVYAQQCASCHGAKGEGIAPNPRLVGTEPGDFSFASDPKLVKTVGNYWPYATTLFDYINRAMPFATPGSLSPGDVYSVVAFLLAENAIIDRAKVIDARSLPLVRMPARDRFVRDDRKGGAGFR